MTTMATADQVLQRFRLIWIDVLRAEGVDPADVLRDSLSYDPATNRVDYRVVLRHPDGLPMRDGDQIATELRHFTAREPLVDRFASRRGGTRVVAHPATYCARCGAEVIDEPMPIARWVWIDISTIDLSNDADYPAHDPYYDRLPWAQANELAAQLVQIGAPADPVYPPDDLPAKLRRGIEAIISDRPIQVIDGHVYEGGHRLRAMNRKGVRRTIGVNHDTPTDPADPPTS